MSADLIPAPVRIAFVPFCVESLSRSEIDRVFKAHGIGLPTDSDPYSKTNLVDAYLTTLASDSVGSQHFLAVANSVMAMAKAKHGESNALTTFTDVCCSHGLRVEDGRLVPAEGSAPRQTATGTGTRRPPGPSRGARRILFLASNPTDTGRLRLDKEVREIDEGLKRSNERERFDLLPKFAVRVEDLRRSLLDHSPQIVHFAGHGEGANGILMESAQGKAFQVPTDALAGLFELCAGHVECVVLNACYSDVQAEAIAKHIPYVIGMAAGVSDDAALEFAVGFYDALGAGKSIEDAFRFGCNGIALKGIPEHLTPVLKKKS